MDNIEEYVIPFGRYRGESLEAIWLVNEEYLEWAAENLEGFVGEIIKEFLESKKEGKDGWV